MGVVDVDTLDTSRARNITIEKYAENAVQMEINYSLFIQAPLWGC